jgi:Tol biopolymer transport system component
MLRISHKRWFSKGLFMAAGLAVGAAILVSSAYGQYFGRNKVQWEKFDYKVLRTEHFDIYYYPEEEQAIKVAGRMAERWYKRFARLLTHELRGKQALVMYASHPQFEQTTVLSEFLGEGTGGVTESLKRRIILPFGGTLEDTDHVLGHELVHAFQYDIASGPGPKYAMQTGGGLERTPLWMIEGAAEYLSVGPVDPNTSMWMRDMLRKKKIPTIKDLTNPYKFNPYRYGQAVWAYIGGKYGDLTAAKLLKDVIRGFDYEKAIEKDLGIGIKKLSEDWHASLKKDYEPVEKATQKPTDLGKLILQGTENDPYNIAPALSPDGKHFMFISSRDLFSIDMFMGDAKTGKVTRKITSTAVDPHFQSIQFINSAGSWNRDGTRFVFGAVNNGKPVLVFADADGQRIGEEIRFPALGEILNPSWAPDGKQIVFSALAGGYSDIYIYDLESQKLRNMTSDAFGDLHPVWSPDGRTIAFITERCNSDLQILNIGNARMALLDPATGEIKPLPAFKDGKTINPQWSSDSKNLFFVSDRNGISNVYRMDVGTHTLFQVTDLYTGVSGITSLSPSLSIASQSNDVLYSVYSEGNYSIYNIDKGKLDGKPVTDVEVLTTPAVLPPKERPGSEILGLLRNPMFGLPDDGKFTSEPYKAKISLDYVAPPQVAVGVDRFGTYAGGGVAFYLSDMLGYHNVMAMAQVYNRIVDSAAMIGYSNSVNRLNFGIVAQRIPYMYGGYQFYMDYVGNEPAYIEEETVYRQINYDIGGFASYPFNQFQRFEINGGYRYLDFSNTVYRYAYSMYDEMLIAKEDYSLPSADGIHMPYVGAAFVYDSSLNGATAPILGQSYRFEVTPTFGTLSYTSALADFRKYIIPVRPFTLALRVVAYGRFGKDAADPRLWPMFLGYDTMIRGYNWESFSAEETGPGKFDFNRLFGNAMMLTNFELRFPLFGALGIGKGYYGIFPVDFVAFYDAGVAWGTDEMGINHKPWFAGGGDRKPITSAGLGVRVNVLGYLVLGVNYVVPFDRPDRKGGYWQFSFYPGF